MNKEETLEEVSRRNTLAVEQALKEMTQRILEQQKRIDGLNAAMSGLTDKQNKLENMLYMMKSQSVGTGPTVRS